jgi:hypothetical protein
MWNQALSKLLVDISTQMGLHLFSPQFGHTGIKERKKGRRMLAAQPV